MIPNRKNFCGGNFQDWLEVNLINICNGCCSWCVENNGYHPIKHVGWKIIVEKTLESNKKNIILLGGEPTLYKHLDKIIQELHQKNRNVWITTNGSLLTKKFAIDVLNGIVGINISIHNYNLDKNKDITGIKLDTSVLRETIKVLHDMSVSVRLNCNCIKGHIDSESALHEYIAFAKDIGADKVRFAELKFDEDNFIDLANICYYKYGLNDDPFIYRCNSNTMIDNMPVNFRQMCGLQTSKRPKPINPEQCYKQVLYYNGKFYKGWQTVKKEPYMNKKKIDELLKPVKEGKISIKDASDKLLKDHEDNLYKVVIKREESSSGCVY